MCLGVLEKVSCIARKYKICTIFNNKTKPKNGTQVIKNSSFSIKCECNEQNIEEIKRPLNIKIGERINNTWLGLIDKLKIAKLIWFENYKFNCKEAKKIQQGGGGGNWSNIYKAIG